jgi:hypothetical protein
MTTPTQQDAPTMFYPLNPAGIFAAPVAVASAPRMHSRACQDGHRAVFFGRPAFLVTAARPI